MSAQRCASKFMLGNVFINELILYLDFIAIIMGVLPMPQNHGWDALLEMVDPCMEPTYF